MSFLISLSLPAPSVCKESVLPSPGGMAKCTLQPSGRGVILSTKENSKGDRECAGYIPGIRPLRKLVPSPLSQLGTSRKGNQPSASDHLPLLWPDQLLSTPPTLPLLRGPFSREPALMSLVHAVPLCSLPVNSHRQGSAPLSLPLSLGSVWGALKRLGNVPFSACSKPL